MDRDRPRHSDRACLSCLRGSAPGVLRTARAGVLRAAGRSMRRRLSLATVVMAATATTVTRTMAAATTAVVTTVTVVTATVTGAVKRGAGITRAARHWRRNHSGLAPYGATQASAPRCAVYCRGWDCLLLQSA